VVGRAKVLVVARFTRRVDATPLQPAVPACPPHAWRSHTRVYHTSEKAKKAARPQADRGSGDDSDGENSRRLTQQAKPTRKAGKKALEAMARDQQRISRNMQLTHQAKTKKRFTTMDLFAKMGYNAPGNGAKTLPTPEASSALASSDGEVNQTHDTPPQSPSQKIPGRKPSEDFIQTHPPNRPTHSSSPPSSSLPQPSS
jgi:hypothetical protein